MPPQRAAAPVAKRSTAVKRQPVATPALSKVKKEPNWLNRVVQGYVGNVGNYASGLIYSVGASVNKVGSNVGGSVTKKTRAWGQGVAGYGNDIKDAVGAGGSRAATAGNPLGLAGGGSQLAASSKGKGTARNPLGL